MKKLFYLVMAGALSLLYFACSSEETVQISEPDTVAYRLKDPETKAAADKYAAMMKTTQYKNMRASIIAFNTNLTIKNRDVSFKDKNEWIDWFEYNYETTKFADKEEFIAMLDDMVDKTGNLVKANEGLFKYIADADADQIAIIVGPERDADYDEFIGSITTTETPCEGGCLDTADIAVDIANNNYYDAMNSLDWAPPLYYWFRLAEERRNQLMAWVSIGSSLNTCICTCNNNCNG